MIKKYLKNSRLEYLDSILKELAKSMGAFVSEDEVAKKVSFEESNHEIFGNMTITKKDIPVGKERMIFRTATIYLEQEDLIIKQVKNPEIPQYMISFKGLELIEQGGLLKQSKNEKIKDGLQKLVWVLALITFIVNTYFQIMNYNNSLKSTSEVNTPPIQPISTK